MFTQQSIKNTILDLEQKYPVDTWKVNGICIWPYVRIKLYIHMLVLMNETPLKGITLDKKKNRVLVLFEKSIFLIRAQVSLIFFFLKLKPKQIVFFGSHIHRVFQKGEYFNRFYDSMIDFHDLQNDVYMVEYQKIQKPIYNREAIIPLVKYLDFYKAVSKIKYRFKNKKDTVSLKFYDDFYNELNNYNLKLSNLRLSQNELVKWTNKINISSNFFNKFYKLINPEKVIFLGYYGLDDLYAALIVANNLKIKTIDFQHGPQTNVHLAFSNWNKIPENGFNTMPIEFWSWDKASKENIDIWAKKTNVIKAKVVGQPYLSYWINKKQISEYSKNHILYSLQTYPFTLNDMLTSKIINLIKKLDCKWILRLHPRNNLNINDLNKFLKDNLIKDKVIVQDAFTVPLPESLMSSIVHLTNYSGCLIEAYQLGLPTILVNEVGYEMFKNYIDDKLVYYLSQDNVDFLAEAKDLILNFKDIDNKSNYSNVFNPLN